MFTDEHDAECNKIAPQLQAIINNGSGELEVTNFLARYPNVVRWTFSKTGGHSTFVLKEFPFGCHYRADFVVLMSRSGGWENLSALACS